MSSIITLIKQAKNSFFIGNLAAAKDEELMKTHNIGFILDVSDVPYETKIPKVSVKMTGDSHQSIIETIEQHIDTCNVFIHCEFSKIRSPTVAILWLKKHYGMSTDEAYKFVKAIHPITEISSLVLRML